MSEVQEKANGWFEQLDKLRVILNEGHAIASEIVGAEPKGATDKARESSCHIERLNDELAQVLRSADCLVSQLRKVNAAF